MDYRVRIYETPWKFALLALPAKLVYTFIVRPALWIKQNAFHVIVITSVVLGALGAAFVLKYFGVLP